VNARFGGISRCYDYPIRICDQPKKKKIKKRTYIGGARRRPETRSIPIAELKNSKSLETLEREKIEGGDRSKKKNHGRDHMSPGLARRIPSVWREEAVLEIKNKNDQKTERDLRCGMNLR